jgi:hypothetical protein
VIDRPEVERLATVRADVAVSVLLPLQRHAPGNNEDRLRLRHLVDAVDRCLREEHAATAVDVTAQLHAAVAEVDLAHPEDGLAVYATASEHHAHLLPFAVPERWVVDRSFATRDLLLGLQHTPRWRVVALSLTDVRVVDGVGVRAEECRAGGFPLHVEARGAGEAPHKDLPVHDDRPEAFRSTFRSADRALTELQRSDPRVLIVAGPERDLAYFDEVTANGEAITGRITGSHVGTAPADLAQLVAPVLVGHEARVRDHAVAALVEAVGKRKAATGTIEVWSAARQGRGHLLVVEADYSVPARVDGDDVELLDADELPRTYDDAVDEIAETVLRHGGDVVFVEAGRLDDYASIGMVLRY